MESQDETNEMKKKLKIMTHQIDQFKEEIGNKESALVKVSLQDAFLKISYFSANRIQPKFSNQSEV